MRQRREWWLCGHSTYTNADCTETEYIPHREHGPVHVREVMANEKPLPFPTMGQYLALMERHAKLVEAAKPIVDYYDNRGIGIGALSERIEALKTALESEVGDE